MDGIFLPPQLIYQGKSPKCLPEIRFPEEWDITYTENHWSNEETTIQYIHNIILPFIHKQKTAKKLLPDQRALCIFDNFKAQLTSDVLQLLKDSFIDTVFVPANCTDQLQPLDLSVNKPAKDFLKRKFEEWYAEQVFINSAKAPIKFPLSTMKPVGAQWIKELYKYISDHPDIIRNGFKAAGVTE